MKFSNGQWLNREGYGVHWPAEVRAVETDEHSVTIYAPDHRIQSRGDTLGGPLITLRFSSPAPNVIRVQAEHFRGRLKKVPEFALNIGNPTVQIKNDEQEVCLTSGGLSVSIAPARRD